MSYSIFNLFRFGRSWKKNDISNLLERLEMYISAGLPLNKSIEIIMQEYSGHRSITLKKVADSIASGSKISSALKEFIGINTTIFAIIKNGESSGQLSLAIQNSRQLLEREDELKKKCLSAMTYPLVIAVFSILMTIGLMKGIMPQIIPMLKSLHVSLPLITRLVIFASDFLSKNWIYVGLSFIFSILIFKLSYSKFICVKFIFQKILTMIPIIGKIFVKYSLSVFLRSCGSLLNSGLFLTDSYRDTAHSVSLILLKNILIKKEEDVRRGVRLAEILKDKIIPVYITSIISAGEATGTLGQSMFRGAEILDKEIEYSLKKLTSLVEPIMMVMMGMFVGVIALSIMMPIYDISKVLQK